MSLLRKIAELEEQGEGFVVITFVSGKGHLPQELGAKAVASTKGLLAGTVGGGLVEARLIEEAGAMLSRGSRDPAYVTYNLQRDLGMTCGGEMSFLLEPVIPHAWNVVIYGAGHVGQALARVLAPMKCRLTVIDARDEWRAKLPAGLRSLDWAQPAERVGELPSHAFHVVMTQDHATDVPILAALAALDPPYVGVIGSRAKSAKLRAELIALGCAPAFVEKIRCPIGLPLGANEPAEIAVSVAAQLLQERK
jgi:xanthine dehydrogenase accessory factor